MSWFRKNFIPRTPDNVAFYSQVLVPGDGPMPCNLMAIGQGPGWVECTSDPPQTFHPLAPAGGELNVYLEQVNLPRDQIYLTNCYKQFVCDHFGSDRAPTKSELWRHWDILEAEILAVEPKVIVCLGAVATKWMMERAQLEYRDAECHRGMPLGWYEYQPGQRALLFSTTHPAAGVHSPDSMKHVLADFQNLSRTVKLIESGKEVPLSIDPLADAVAYSRLHTADSLARVWGDFPWMGMDTEGTAKSPLMLQFSHQAGTGYAIYVSDAELIQAFSARLQAFCAAPSQVHSAKLFLQNALYDINVLHKMGIELPDGSWLDTMVMAFLLGVEPLGLKPLSYRFTGLKMESYDEQVGPKSEEFAFNYLLEAACHDWPTAEERLIREGPNFRLYKPQAIGIRIEKILKDWSEQDLKIEHVTHIEMEDVNKKGEKKLKRHTHDYYVKKMGKCPVGCREVKVEREEPVNVRRRWYNADRELRTPVEEKLGRMPSATLLDIEETQAIIYANRDADGTNRIGPLLLSRIKEMDLEVPLDIDMRVQPMLACMMRTGIPADRNHFIKFGIECQGRMDQIQYEIYKLTESNINLGSGPQLANLLFGQLRLPSNRWTESRDRLATDKKALEPLRYMHPAVPLVIEWGELDTLKNNFAEVLPDKLGEDGRVHCKIGMTRVPTGRLNTSDPNLMAQPTRSEVGRRIREGFHAPPGYKIVCCDQSQIELRMLTEFSGDKVLAEVYDKNLDLHRDTGMRMFQVSEPTDIQRGVGKTINFLIANRGGGQALLDQLKLQAIAANDWQPNTRYIEGAVIQNRVTRRLKDCHKFQACTEGVSRGFDPDWNREADGVTSERSILWVEVGPGWTREMCDFYVAKWYADHPAVDPWHQRLFAEARRYGYVRGWTGRLRYSPEIRSSIQRIREAGEKQIANTPIQLGAQETMKIGMRLIWDEMHTGRLRKMKIEPYLEIHDDFMAGVEDAAVDDYCGIVTDIMSNKLPEFIASEYHYQFKTRFGAECKIGQTWAGVKKVKH